MDESSTTDVLTPRKGRIQQLITDSGFGFVVSLVIGFVFASLAAAGIINMGLAAALLVIGLLIGVGAPFFTGPAWFRSTRSKVFTPIVLVAVMVPFYFFERAHFQGPPAPTVTPTLTPTPTPPPPAPQAQSPPPLTSVCTDAKDSNCFGTVNGPVTINPKQVMPKARPPESDEILLLHKAFDAATSCNLFVSAAFARLAKQRQSIEDNKFLSEDNRKKALQFAEDNIRRDTDQTFMSDYSDEDVEVRRLLLKRGMLDNSDGAREFHWITEAETLLKQYNGQVTLQTVGPHLVGISSICDDLGFLTKQYAEKLFSEAKVSARDINTYRTGLSFVRSTE